MSLTVNCYNLAEVRVQGITLRPILDAYELLFGLHITINPSPDMSRSAVVAGAEASVRLVGGMRGLGFARPDMPIRVEGSKFSNLVAPFLRLTILPQQLAALEELRDGGDVDFEFQALGEGRDLQVQHQIQDQWRFHIPRSTWIKQLRDAGALDVLLFEVPLPVGPAPKGLDDAHRHFISGDYRACVADCRSVIQEIGQQKLGKTKWSNDSLRLLSAGGDVSKDEREAGIWASVLRYTNLAHHSESEGGVATYTRSEAHFVLICTAAICDRWIRDG